MINASNIAEINEKYQSMEPRDILREILTHYPQAAISFSGAEDVALVVMAKKLQPAIRVFTLDTGRLHPETYRFIDQIREQYSLDLEFLYPDTAAVQALTREKGLFSFTRMGMNNAVAFAKLNHYGANCQRSRPGSPVSARIRVPLARMFPWLSLTQALLHRAKPCSSSTPLPTGAPKTSGTTSVCLMYPTTRCMIVVLSVSAANPAPKPLAPISTNVRVAGGGRKPQPKSVVCTF